MGSIASARAIATRCCWPPESWPGNLSLCALQAHALQHPQPPPGRLVLGAAENLHLGERQVLVTDRWGKSSKCWNTMPTRLRRRGRSVRGSVEADAVHHDVAAAGTARARSRLDQRALARAGRPADDDHLALGDAGGAVGQHLEDAVPLADAVDGDQVGAGRWSGRIDARNGPARKAGQREYARLQAGIASAKSRPLCWSCHMWA